MELELGLALPTTGDFILNGFDLNTDTDDHVQLHGHSRKGDLFENDAFDPLETPTLPLFVHDQADAYGHINELNDQTDCQLSPNNGDGQVPVGWPPIKRIVAGAAAGRCCYGRMLCGDAAISNTTTTNNNDDDDKSPNHDDQHHSRWVKVKMEGVGIGRKVDLSLFNSYSALFHTLSQMFPALPVDDQKVIRKGDDDNDDDDGKRQQNYSYRVTYEDIHGDWMLIGDVPWKAFIRSVKRLKISTR